MLELADVVNVWRRPHNESIRDAIDFMLNDFLPDVRKDDIAGEPEVIVDTSTLGPAVLGPFNDAKIQVIEAVIKGRGIFDESTVNRLVVGRTTLLGLTSIMLGNRLKIRQGVELRDEIMKDLRNADPYRRSRNNEHDPEAWRELPNDDLMFAIALATWWSDANPYLPEAAKSRTNRLFEEHNKKFVQTIV